MYMKKITLFLLTVPLVVVGAIISVPDLIASLFHSKPSSGLSSAFIAHADDTTPVEGQGQGEAQGEGEGEGEGEGCSGEGGGGEGGGEGA